MYGRNMNKIDKSQTNTHTNTIEEETKNAKKIHGKPRNRRETHRKTLNTKM